MSDDNDPADTLLDEKSRERANRLTDKIVAEIDGYSGGEIAQALMNVVLSLCRAADTEEGPGLGTRLAEIVFMWQRSISSGDAMNFWDRLEELTDPDCHGDDDETIN